MLPYGNGRSYGDLCLNEGGTLLDCRGLDRFIAFDPATGILRAEGGVLLSAILERIVPHGWFLPVTPGTRYITLGGAIYVSAVCVLPSILITKFNVPFYFGGTALLIVVGVSIDTVAQMESHMLTRHYEGFLKKSSGSKIRGRR